MSVIFSSVMADVAIDFVQKFPNEVSCTSCLQNICGRVGLECRFTPDKSYRLAGSWKAMENAHDMLQAVFENYNATADGASTVNSFGLVYDTKVGFKSETATTQLPNVVAKHHGEEGFSPSQEPVLKRRVRKVRPFENRPVSNEASELHIQESMRNNSSQIPLDCPEDSLVEKKQRNNRESLSTAQSDFGVDAEGDSGEPSLDNYESAPVTSDGEMTKKTKRRKVTKRMPAKRKRSRVKSTEKGGGTNGHKTAVNLTQVKGSRRLKKSATERYACTDCNFIANSKYSLKSHRSTVHLASPAVCDVCRKVFRNGRYLRRHQASHGEAQHSCDQCGKLYKGRKALREHQQRHQEGYSRPALPCPQCQKTFCNQYLLSCHIRAHHQGQRTLFLCSVCGKNFTTKHSMQEHMNSHTGAKPYKCETCSKAFSYESALRDHRFVHQETKQFTCPVCHKSFSQRSGLKVHSRIHNGIRQFQCKECGRAFTQKQALQRHERSHKGDKPFTCNLCERTFIDASIICRHLSLVHKIHKDSKTWREDITYNPSNIGERSMTASADSEPRGKTDPPGKVQDPVTVVALTTQNISGQYSEDGGHPSPQKDHLHVSAANQEGSLTFPQNLSLQWLTNTALPLATPAPVDYLSLMPHASNLLPLPMSKEAPESLLSGHTQPTFSPAADDGIAIPTGQPSVDSSVNFQKATENVAAGTPTLDGGRCPTTQAPSAQFQVASVGTPGTGGERPRLGDLGQPWLPQPSLFPQPVGVGQPAAASREQPQLCTDQSGPGSTSPSPSPSLHGSFMPVSSSQI